MGSLGASRLACSHSRLRSTAAAMNSSPSGLGASIFVTMSAKPASGIDSKGTAMIVSPPISAKAALNSFSHDSVKLRLRTSKVAAMRRWPRW